MEVATGSSVVKINQSRHVPCFILINGSIAKSGTRTGPCDICYGGHKVTACPYKGKFL